MLGRPRLGPIALVLGLLIPGPPVALAQGGTPVGGDCPPPPRYTLTDLGTFGGSSGVALNLNAAGQVVGFADGPSPDSGLPLDRAFLWTAGTLQELLAPALLREEGADPTLEPKDGTAAVDVNATGQVVGSAREFLTVRFHPLVWKDGQPTVLATLSGQTGAASAINDAGQIVGGATTGEFSQPHPVRWDDGQVTDLGTLGGDQGGASDINEAGQIVGTAETADNQFHAFLWDRGQMIDLNVHGGLDASVPSAAHAVNDRGQIAGEFQPPGSGLHAAVWDGGRLIDLGTRGGVYGVARDIDNAGRVVGETKVDPDHGAAVLWIGGCSFDLNDLVPPIADQTLVTATAINDAGQIVGYALRNPGIGSTLRPYLLTPAAA